MFGLIHSYHRKRDRILQLWGSWSSQAFQQTGTLSPPKLTFSDFSSTSNTEYDESPNILGAIKTRETKEHKNRWSSSSSSDISTIGSSNHSTGKIHNEIKEHIFNSNRGRYMPSISRAHFKSRKIKEMYLARVQRIKLRCKRFNSTLLSSLRINPDTTTTTATKPPGIFKFTIKVVGSKSSEDITGSLFSSSTSDEPSLSKKASSQKGYPMFSPDNSSVIGYESRHTESTDHCVAFNIRREELPIVENDWDKMSHSRDDVSKANQTSLYSSMGSLRHLASALAVLHCYHLQAQPQPSEIQEEHLDIQSPPIVDISQESILSSVSEESKPLTNDTHSMRQKRRALVVKYASQLSLKLSSVSSLNVPEAPECTAKQKFKRPSIRNTPTRLAGWLGSFRNSKLKA